MQDFELDLFQNKLDITQSLNAIRYEEFSMVGEIFDSYISSVLFSSV